MVKLINESKDNSDAMLDALVKACKQVYGKEWDHKSDKEQRDIIMGFIKQAADNAKKSKKESMNTRRRTRRMNEDVDKLGRYLDEANSDMYTICDNLRNALREIRISDLTESEKDDLQYIFGEIKNKFDFSLNNLIYDIEEKLNEL